MENITKVINELASTKAYNEHRWDDFLIVVEVELKAATDRLKHYLLFRKATALVKSGKVDRALPIYRQLLDVTDLETIIAISVCKNLATLAVLKGDFEFAEKCALEYNKICNDRKVTAEHWSDLICDRNSLESRFDHYIEIYAGLDTPSKKHFQTIISQICNIKKDREVLFRFYSIIESENSFNMNFLSTVFVRHFDDCDVSNMRKVYEIADRNRRSPQCELICDYMKLCIMDAENENIEEKQELAKRIIVSLSNSTVYQHGSLIEICSKVIKEADKHDNVLVPTKFGIIGITPAVSELRDRIERYARSCSHVMIRGESGTGKELAAQALHDAGDRAGEPFVPVNCPAVPESVFESQLFGHVAGAFTGAAKDQPGLIELAGDGTLFLDEVGDLPAGVQAKLLRFLENGEYRRLGSERVRKSRARVLAATNRNLAGQERFRQDLYHRLRRLEIVMPPLAERREDIRYLARHRVRQLNLQDGSGWKQLDEAAERRLEALDYPGNVRELFNLVDHAWHEAVQPIGEAEVERARQRLEAERADAAGGQAQTLSFDDAQAWSLDFATAGAPLKQIQEQAARRAIRQALEHFKGDVDQSARFLDVSRRSIYRYLERERESERS